MKLALSLLAIYALGKGYAVVTHQLWAGPAIPFVLLWQDILVAAAVGFVWSLNHRAAWTLYAVAMLHFAISMPLFRLMATPLTGPILLAGGNALADSIEHHFDLTNISLMLATISAAAAFPWLLKRFPLRHPLALAVVATACVIAGVFLTPRTDLQGLHRNSVIAFVGSFAEAATPMPPSARATLRKATAPWASSGSLRGANVLLIGLESTGSRYLAPYGAKTDPMPFLTQMTRDGVLFENAYAAYPESIKGLLSVLASRLPQFGVDESEFRARSHPSLATVCRAAGYDTALFHSGRFMYLGMDEVLGGAQFDLAEDAGDIGGNHNSSFGVDDYSTVDRILNWVVKRQESHASSPFFIHYLPIAGHHPYISPLDGPFRETDDPSRYLNALHYSDLALRRLIEGLDGRGALGNTLVLIYGDHGEAFGEHPGNFGHTLYLYEENVRVPLILWAPGKLRPARVERIVSLSDLAPTLCDLIGLTPPPSFEGISALAELQRPAVFLTDYSMRLLGVRFDRWKFIDEKDTGFTRLYDLQIDPGERANLAALHPELIRDLRSDIFDWSRVPKPPKLSANPESFAQR